MKLKNKMFLILFISYLNICNSFSINKEDVSNNMKKLENQIFGTNNYTTSSSDTNTEFYEEISFYILVGCILLFICVISCICCKCKKCLCC